MTRSVYSEMMRALNDSVYSAEEESEHQELELNATQVYHPSVHLVPASPSELAQNSSCDESECDDNIQATSTSEAIWHGHTRGYWRR